MKYFLTIILCLFLPLASHAMADLSISQEDVSFSKEVLIAGDTVRIYATVRNIGDEDVSGFVTFYQGSEIIGQSQVISLLADGSPDQVFVDFVVPIGEFNVLAMIKGSDPADENSENDSTITERFDPILDDDRDGIEDALDICPSVADASQIDTDGDGKGNACDVDDDNDGVSDEVEKEIGSDPLDSDSDDDGIEDADDAYPIGNDPVLEIEEEVIADEIFQESEDTSSAFAISKIVSDLSGLVQKEGIDEGDVVIEKLPQVDFSASPNAVFSYSRADWNQFVFSVLEPEGEGRLYRWDFGDGITSGKREVEHTFAISGSYDVTLTIEDTSGKVSTERAVILVPFFTLQNRLVMTSVVLLALLIILTITSLVVSARKEHA